jgi:hypothetical protein
MNCCGGTADDIESSPKPAIITVLDRHWFNPNLLNMGQEGVVCSHALRGGDWVWLAQSLSPAG